MTDLREIDCEDGRWMALLQNHVQWQDLVTAVLNFQLLLPVKWLFNSSESNLCHLAQLLSLLKVTAVLDLVW